MTGRGLTRRAGLVALGRAAGTLSLFAVNAILVRSYPATDVGAFSAIWVLSNLLVPLFLAGLPTALLYVYPRRPRGRRSLLVRHTAWCLLVSGLLLALLLAAAGTQLARWRWLGSDAQPGVDLGQYLVPFLPFAFSLVASGFAEPALVAAGRAGWQALLAALGAAGLVAAAGSGAGLGLSMHAVLGLFSGVGLLRWAASAWLVRRATREPEAADEGGSGIGECLRYAVPIGVSDAVGALSRSVDRLVVLSFFPVETFALYHLGAVEVPISLLLAAVATVLLPEVSRRHQAGDLEGVGRLWQQAMARLALVVLPLFAFLFCFAEPLLLAYLSDPYRRSLWVFRLFLLVLPLRIAVYNPLLVGIGRATWALWASVADLLLNLLLSLALVHLLQARQPAWAFLGPALAAVCSTYVQVGVLLVLIAGRLRLGLAGLLPWATLLRVGAAAAAAALLSLGAAALLSGPWARLGVGGAAFAALMLAALWLHPADRREVAEIGRALRRG